MSIYAASINNGYGIIVIVHACETAIKNTTTVDKMKQERNDRWSDGISVGALKPEVTFSIQLLNSIDILRL